MKTLICLRLSVLDQLLLTTFQTRGGEHAWWTTFSADQVDLDWTSPDLLFEFFDIILLYLSKGCRILRLDAVAFLWKKIGTSCLHLPETHEVVKLIRNLLEVVALRFILTETSVPHEKTFLISEKETKLMPSTSLPFRLCSFMGCFAERPSTSLPGPRICPLPEGLSFSELHRKS